MVARGMNLVPEKRELFGAMSVDDNLLLGAFHRYRQGLRDQEETRDQVFRIFPRLKERRTSTPVPCRAASARCWPWAAP